MVSKKELLELIKTLRTPSMTLHGIEPIFVDGGFERGCYNISSDYRHTGVKYEWPFWFCRFTYRSDLEVRYERYNEQLTAPNLPPYRNLYDAARQFLDISVNSAPNPNAPLSIHFIIPDYRARIRTVEINENTSIIHVEARETHMDNLVLQFSCKNNHEDTSLEKVDIKEDGLAEIKLSYEPKEADAYLLELDSGENIDSKSVGGIYGDHTEDVTLKTSKGKVKDVIARGENAQTEFKLQLGKNHDEFLETAVAFANSKGGKIFVGISDNKEICGCYGNLDDLDKSIRGLIENRCEPDIDFDIEQLTFDKKQIFVVTIQKGTDKPYMVKEKSAYKRIGAADRVFTRHGFDEIYSDRNNPVGTSNIMF